MAFWGIEVKPGKPYTHEYDDEKGRLHISQATLGNGSSTKRSIVQCNVGDKKPINLCSLLPEKVETCALNLEFEEDDEVTFSVLGPHSVHLSGFFYGADEDEDEENPYGEDIMATDSEEEHACIDCDSEDHEDDSIDGFIDDDDDLGMYSSSPVRNSGVRIEEIEDEEKPNENGMSKRAKKKKSQLSKSDDNDDNRQIVVKTGTGVPIFESEDEDGFPKSASESKSDLNSESKTEDIDNGRADLKSNAKDKNETAQGKKLKRKIDAVVQDGEHTRENNEQPEDKVEQKKKNKKKKKREAEKEQDAQESAIAKSGGVEKSSLAENGNDLKPTTANKKEKKKQQGSGATPNSEEKITAKKGSVVEKQEKAAAKSLQVRTFPNGLVIEELAMGKPDGKKATPGKKVSVRYIGKLKKNEKIFDSNIGRAPFKFRLGIGQVIKGWDVGVNGMRIGDKRRLTIPPAMGYGSKGAGPAIPPNSWLVFDVELVDVN